MVKLEQELGKKRDNTKGTSSKPQNNMLCHYLEYGTVFKAGKKQGKLWKPSVTKCNS